MHATTIDRAYRPRPWVTFRLFAPLLLALSVVLGGCTMSETEQRTVSGAGYIVDQQKKREDAEAESAKLRQQNQQMQQQQTQPQ
jgi:hypothetical protein